MKESAVMRSYRKRWLVLTPERLYSFKSERRYENPTEDVDLKLCGTVKSADDITNKSFSFTVQVRRTPAPPAAATRGEQVPLSRRRRCRTATFSSWHRATPSATSGWRPSAAPPPSRAASAPTQRRLSIRSNRRDSAAGRERRRRPTRTRRPCRRRAARASSEERAAGERPRRTSACERGRTPWFLCACVWEHVQLYAATRGARELLGTLFVCSREYVRRR